MSPNVTELVAALADFENDEEGSARQSLGQVHRATLRSG
jgi:predicted unusual protein kinase regulating ubiquinone biosynthesis (AarF/ABC1/UbiB family)